MLYFIYFLLTVLVVIVMITMVKLYRIGFRIEFEVNQNNYKKVKNNVRRFFKFLVETRIDVPILTVSEKTIYNKIRKDIPDFDIEVMNREIRNQISNYVKSQKDGKIHNKNNLTRDFEDNFKISQKDEAKQNTLDIKDYSTVYTLLERYKRNGNLGYATFSTIVSYNDKNQYLKRMEDNYIAEFVRNIKMKNYHKNICPKCGEIIRKIKNYDKCPKCGIIIDNDAWYLNNIKKI